MCLHLGCGPVDYPGFINIDKYPFQHVHYLRNVKRLPHFKNESADLIYISHCLEHFSYLEVPGILNEYYRVLKPGGILRISVPDFDKILTIYEKEQTIESIEQRVLGGHDYKFNFHYAIFNQSYLEKLLTSAGFGTVKNWEFGTGPFKDLPDWSGKKVLVNPGNREYEISLNIEAIK